ncbi:MAG: Hsp20/alpha crystallin family protein [Candidatus Campbellbacteria bacterium]|nr:Hsp20/alpha crystallin family protein [Candidatus Campbellbacteria bacterium]
MKNKKSKKKKGFSFFELLTGTNEDELEEELSDEEEVEGGETSRALPQNEDEERHLPVDLINTPDDIIIRANLAGINPDNIDLSVSREVIIITAKNARKHEEQECDYFYQELYWGTLSRTIVLPQEIEVEDVTADTKNGMLTIVLPKIDKDKKTKVRVSKR